MDYFGYWEIGDEEGVNPSLRIGALASRWNAWLGESALMPLLPLYWERNPFSSSRLAKVSANLQMAPVGTVDGHNTVQDSTIMDSMRVDKAVPVSPLFVKDLAGRIIYAGFGPEVKGNDEWAAYRPPLAADGKIDEENFNPFVPLVTFPRFCRDTEEMEGQGLLENVFLTKFRCLEMSMGYNAKLSGSEEEDDLVSATYMGANLYPYKLRLDTFYTDGWKLPQTQMVYALSHGVDVAAARAVGQEFLEKWRLREVGTKYETWLEEIGGAEQVERWYRRGCTLIPTFEACNGYNVVGKEFELQDYWPGRAVPGLHVVVEARPNKAPAGTILQVVSPGYITAAHIEQAQVIVSDGSGYISVHSDDPIPWIPNMNLPHQRAIADWQSVWLPTHPLHFEAPAIWGWELNSGRFLQLSGPLWDPLHYYYGCVDEVLKAFETPFSKLENRWLVRVPEHMRNRFYPVVPMEGFDTISDEAYNNRAAAQILPRSSLKRVKNGKVTAGIGYHPLPAEFEFEIEPFWFPDLHPLNRQIEECPDKMKNFIIPIIDPGVGVQEYIESVDGPLVADWLTEPGRMLEPVGDAFENYPHLTRYLLPDLELNDLMKLCPMPLLSDVGGYLKREARQWWRNAEGEALDLDEDLLALQPGIAAALWHAREAMVENTKFRHMIYQENLPLYMLAWWFGSSLESLQEMAASWIGGGIGAGKASEQEKQKEALEKMQAAARPTAPQAEGLPEEKF